jgi:heterodisulfide reductase subunit A-like polyferredoxin
MNSERARSRSPWMTARIPQAKPLSCDVKTEMLVIGGGIAGLSTAYELVRAGHDVILTERVA